ncbi:prohibitin family protein [Candidatus Dojkabacteria bacterium]|jgi:regulator of protease activity HflC (stomatin/prohibitin superfamily)|nr:prohibitin family protein [Candidatus Dojkabacteria bacterium]
MVSNSDRDDSGLIWIKLTIWAIIALVVIIILFSSVYIIGAGQRGILLTFGKPSMEAKTEGLHFKIPLVQTIVKMDVKTQKYEADASAASKDLQDVTSKIATNYHLTPEYVPQLYKEIGTGYEVRVIQPAEQEAVKSITAQFTAEELITKRELVREKIKTLLQEKLSARGLVIEDVSIVDFSFSPSFTQAIEAKVTAEQNALAAKNKLEQIKYEADQRVTQANGEATAIRIQAEAITAQGGAEYVQLQFINKWDGKLSTVSMSGGATPIIDVSRFVSVPGAIQ